MALLLLTLPPIPATVTTSVAVTSTARSSMAPSLTRIWSPGRTSSVSVWSVVLQRSFVPGTSSTVMTKRSPGSMISDPFGNLPSRILGPCRAANTPTGRPAASAAWRT